MNSYFINGFYCIAINGLFLVRNLHQELPFMAMLIPRSTGTCLSKIFWQEPFKKKNKLFNLKFKATSLLYLSFFVCS